MLTSVFGKTMHDLRRGLIGWGIGIAATVGLMAAIWPSFSDVDFESIMEQYPEALMEVFNVTDMGTPSGYLNAELFSLMLPAMFIIYAVGRGARLIAGEEEDGTLETLASLPVPRTRLLVEKAAALVVGVAVLGVVLFLSTWASSAAVGMDVPVADIGRASLSMVLLGSELGLLALAVGASTGRRGLSVGIGSGIAGGAYLLFLVGQLVDVFEPLLPASPFYQAISEGPLGPDLPLIVLWMPVVGLAALAAAIPVFDRRDLSV